MNIHEFQAIIAEHTILSAAYFLFFGAAIGSFCHFLAYRIANGLQVSESQSRCDHCGILLKRRFNIPILGYLLLKGRTSCCDKRLSPQHFIYELIFGVVAVLFLTTHTLSVDSLFAMFMWFIASTAILVLNHKKSFTSQDKWLLLICSLGIVILLSSDEHANYFYTNVFFFYFFLAYISLEFIRYWLDKKGKLNTDYPLLYIIPVMVWGEIFIIAVVASLLGPTLKKRHEKIQNAAVWIAITTLLLR